MLDAPLRYCLTDSVQLLDLSPSPETPQPRSVSLESLDEEDTYSPNLQVLTWASGLHWFCRLPSLLCILDSGSVCYLLDGIRGRMALLYRPLCFRWSYTKLYFSLSFLRAPALGRPAFFPGSPYPIAHSPASCQAGSSAAFQRDLPFSLSLSSSATLGTPSLEHVGVRYYGNWRKRSKLMERGMAEIGNTGMGGGIGNGRLGNRDGSGGMRDEWEWVFLHLTIFVILTMNFPMTSKPIAPFWSVGCVQFPAGWKTWEWPGEMSFWASSAVSSCNGWWVGRDQNLWLLAIIASFPTLLFGFLCPSLPFLGMSIIPTSLSGFSCSSQIACVLPLFPTGCHSPCFSLENVSAVHSRRWTFPLLTLFLLVIFFLSRRGIYYSAYYNEFAKSIKTIRNLFEQHSSKELCMMMELFCIFAV